MDTIQLDYRREDTQEAMRAVLNSVANRCDGVRCDMAMLVLRDVFARTWESFPSVLAPPKPEFWPETIRKIKSQHENFLFLAEAYWGLEPKLQEFGFDHVYDKVLYDKIVTRDFGKARAYLAGLSPEFVHKSAHFLENHDELRIASILDFAQHSEAAAIVLELPGLRLLHEGQLDGARVKVPVQLLRRCAEAPDPQLRRFYCHLLPSLARMA